MKLLLLLLVMHVGCTLAAVSLANKSRFKEFFDKAVTAAFSDDFATCIDYLKKALIENPQHVDANQLLGTAYLKVGNSKDSVAHLKRATELDNFQDLNIVGNYIEALRYDGLLHESRNIGNKVIARQWQHPVASYAGLYFNLAMVEMELQDFHRAIELLNWNIEFQKDNFKAWKSASEILVDRISPAEGEAFLRKAIIQFPDSHYLHFMLGAALHHQKKLEEALHYYHLCEQLNPTYYQVKANIGAAFQALGRAQDALYYYELTLPHITNDAGVYNNYGALLGTMGRKQEEVKWLKKALELEPTMEQALVNLGGYYQDEGMLEEAADYLTRGLPNSPCPGILKLRIALIMSPVSPSWEHMLQERKTIEKNLDSIARDRATALIPTTKSPLDTTIDRIHFYVQYHGLNDRHFQERVMREYYEHVDDLNYTSPHLKPSLNSVIAPGQKARIAFISKFFGIFEPHGLLLDGIMKYLPRSHFTVIALPVARTDIKPLSPGISEVVDEVVEVSLSYAHALEMVRNLNIDILVFADSMCEPMTHFLVHNRVAKVQVVFWGNPITSASHHIDYFVSADVMEHPFRNRMLLEDEPYTEQVVTLEGQGIWYEKPSDPDIDLIKTNIKHLVKKSTIVTRASFNISEDVFLFLLPQSVFKIHPEYDKVLGEILARNPTAHLAVTGGRRESWTEVYVKRLRESIAPQDQSRLHVIERVSSEQFDTLLLLSDVILHPFPFDGSKTAADALNANRPIVTLPTEYLRGRMGLAFLKTMNMPELVARNISEYVSIATRLCDDKKFYAKVVTDLKEKVDLIWQDLEVPYAWTRFLSATIDVHPVSSFEDFVRQLPGRDFKQEMALYKKRQANRKAFDAVWGEERYMLDHGIARLESTLPDGEIPRIFKNWKSTHQATSLPLTSGGNGKHTTEKTHHSKTFTSTVHADSRGIKISPLSSPVKMGSIPAEIYVKNIQKRTGTGGGSIGISDKKSIGSGVGISIASDSTLLTSSFAIPSVNILGASTIAATTANNDKQLKDQAILNAFRSQLQKGKYKEAWKLGISLFESHKNDAMYLLEMGATAYFDGEYQSAFDYCSMAAKIAPDASLVHSCVGVAAMYLTGKQQDAINSFQTSLTIMNKLRDQSSQKNPGFVTIKKDDTADIQSKQLFSSIFSVSRDVVEGNLIHSYQAFKMYEQCLDFPHKFYNIPPAYRGGAFILVFSAVDWSKESQFTLRDVEKQLRELNVLDLPTDKTLYSEIVRIQTEIAHIINPTILCLSELQDANLRNDVFGTLMNIVMLNEDAKVNVKTTANQLTSEVIKKNGIALISQYYEPKDQATRFDLNYVLTKNLANPAISEIYLLNEKLFNFSTFPNAHKIQQLNIGKRLTFKKAFEFANEQLSGRTVMLANADVYFDHTLLRLDVSSFQKGPKRLLSLLKWVDSGDSIELKLRTDSQDVWIFQSPVDGGIPLLSDFNMGIPRCDNRIAQVFHTYNYSVLNPAFAIHGIEVQSVGRQGNLYGMKDAAYGSGRNVLLSDQFVF